MRLSPHPDVYVHYCLALVHLWLGNLDNALEHARENERREAGEPYSAALLSAVHGFRGEHVKSAAAVERLLADTPSFSLKNIRHSELYRDPAYLARLCEVLRVAGLAD